MMINRQKGNPYALKEGGTSGGFTMIELVIAMVVLTFGLVSLVGMSAYISRANSISNTLSVLATAGQDQVDVIRSAIWTLDSDNDPRIAAGGSLTANVTNHYQLKSNTPAGNLIVRWVVINGPGTTGDVRTVTIRVVQENPPSNMSNGYTVTTVLNRN